MAQELCLFKGTIRCSPSADKSCKSRAEHETRESLQSLHVPLVLRLLVLRLFDLTSLASRPHILISAL